MNPTSATMARASAASAPCRVSALVSTYNAERFIRGCLEDLVGQTLFQQGQLEILVVNSGSQENEAAVVREFQARYPRIVYLHTPRRETLYAAWNRAIAVASGQYLTNANTDDRHRPDALERLADELDARNVGLVYADSLATRHPHETFARNRAEWVLRWPDFSLRQFLLGHLCGAQPMWRRAAHEVVGLFDPQFVVAGDLDFFLRLTARLGGYHLRELLGLYLKDVGLESRHPAVCREETARVLRHHRLATPLERIYPWLQDHPDSAEARVAALVDYANALLSVPEPDRELAERFYHQALELAPAHSAVLNNLAVVAGQRGEVERARSWLEQAGDFALARENLRILAEFPEAPATLALADIPHPVWQSLPPLVRPGSHWQPWEAPAAAAAEAAAASAPAPLAGAPAVSVVIPCYNQAAFLAEAVESVVGQTLREWEIIIVNDGSTDDTSAAARRLLAQYPGRITLLEQPNGGPSSARNAGIKAARAEYVFVLDADDRMSRRLLAAAKAVLDGQPEVGFAYADFRYFGEEEGVFRFPAFDAATLIYERNIVCAGSLLRKRMWAEVGGYNESMRHGYEDWDFWIACAERGWRGWRIPEPLFFYRVRRRSRSTTALDHDLRLRAQIVANHPRLYNQTTQAWARAILQGQPAAADATPGLPAELLHQSRAAERWRRLTQQLRHERAELEAALRAIEQHRDRLQREHEQRRVCLRRNPFTRLTRAVQRIARQVASLGR